MSFLRPGNVRDKLSPPASTHIGDTDRWWTLQILHEGEWDWGRQEHVAVHLL